MEKHHLTVRLGEVSKTRVRQAFEVVQVPMMGSVLGPGGSFHFEGLSFFDMMKKESKKIGKR